VNIDANAAAGEVATLMASLRTNLPLLVRAQFHLSKQLVGSAKVLVDVGADLPEAIGKASLQAGACVAAAASAVARASVRVNASVEASASVTGKAGANI
jgi:hypothetical protein